jgi:hypothetical protein
MAGDAPGGFEGSGDSGDEDDDPLPPEQLSIWPVVAAIDYLLREVVQMSPMTAYLLRMARQNLLDEHLSRKDGCGED